MTDNTEDYRDVQDAEDRRADDRRRDRIDRELTDQADIRLAKLEEQLRADGYDLNALDRDNPYNQWMYES